MTNRDFYKYVLGMSDMNIRDKHDKFCRSQDTHSCVTCKFRQKMLASPNSAGQSCFTFWLNLERSETPRVQELTPSGSSSKPEPKPKSVNNETSFTMLDE